MGKLDARAARRFARHCDACSECARISAREREMIRLIRAALAEKPPELMITMPPVIFAGPWPEFTPDVEQHIARNEYQAEPVNLPGTQDDPDAGLLTFRWFKFGNRRLQ